MIIDQLIKQEREIHDSVTRLCVDPTGKADPIYDGVADPASYLAAPARILWILKEPWDGDDRSGGGWSLTQDLLNQRPAEMAKGRTFQPITYVTYGIFNRVWSRKDMPLIRSKPEMAFLLRSIAFINVKKLPGLKRSNNGEILQAYRASRDIILQQISAYQPDYILGCRPHMSAIVEDLGATTAEITIQNSVRHAKIGNCLLFNVYHPAQHTISRDRYINDILEVVASKRPKALEPTAPAPSVLD